MTISWLAQLPFKYHNGPKFFAIMIEVIGPSHFSYQYSYCWTQRVSNKINNIAIRLHWVWQKKKNKWIDIHFLCTFGLHRLTHCGLMMPNCITKLCHHWFRQWLVACSAPRHYLNQCWLSNIWLLRSEIWIKIPKFSVKKMHLKMSPATWWPFCSGLNVFTTRICYTCVSCWKPCGTLWYLHPLYSQVLL